MSDLIKVKALLITRRLSGDIIYSGFIISRC